MCQEGRPGVKNDVGWRTRRFCRFRPPAPAHEKAQGSRSSLALTRPPWADYFFAGTGVFAYSIAKLA